jgi:biotin transporter BioY
MRRRLIILHLLLAAGFAMLAVLSFVVMFKVGAPVFLSGAIGCTVALRVLGERWTRRR